jgi:hypothetical protein
MSESFVGIYFENLPNSSTLASLQEHYICFTDNLYDACHKVYVSMLNQSIDFKNTNKTFHIEKYNMSLEELHYSEKLPHPINFYTFNSQFECICNRTNEIIWQP